MVFSICKDLAYAVLKLLSSSILPLIIFHTGTEMKGVKSCLMLGMGTDLKPSKGFMDALQVS